MAAPRTVSIVIPTHDRRASAERALRALVAQSYPLTAIEVVLVADGCTDATAGIAQAGWPFALRVIEQPGRGPAAARNRGAGAATGGLLIFLDDDIEALPGFVAAHVRAHADDDPARVAIGYLPPELQGRRDFFAIMLRAWWEAMFERMREPGHRFAYSDLLSGNFSVARATFARVGGFDETLRCHEDYELGLRLIAAGSRFQFAPDAAGWHHEHTDLARALSRKRDEGRADVALAHRHPGLASILPLSASDHRLSTRGRALKHFALAPSSAGTLLESSCRSMLPALERARLRTRWRRLLDDLLSYWYWRGVSESLAGAPLESVRSQPVVSDAGIFDVDLRAGFDAAMSAIDAAAPASVRLNWGRLIIGTVAAQPGAEPLQGRHLPQLLRTRFAQRFAETLALADRLEGSGAPLTAPRVHAAAETRRI
jgi:GT2 family glycosyltransferase